MPIYFYDMAGTDTSASSASSDFTMSSLSGTASSRSRSDNISYRPTRNRGRSTSVCGVAAPAAPYYDRAPSLHAIRDRGSDIESGADREDALRKAALRPSKRRL